MWRIAREMERATRIRREGAEHECVKEGVANRTWPIQDIEKKMGSAGLRESKNKQCN